MKISIIIPNYNGKCFLQQCLTTLYKQSCKDFEVIIVDNASSDGSVIYLQEFYPQVKVIRFEENCGFSSAVNAGIKASRCDYVVLLNNDTELDVYWLENLLKCIEADEKIFSCASKMIQHYDRQKIDNVGDFYCIFGWTYHRGDGESIDKYVVSTDIFSSCAGAAIYRRKVFNQIGYFDEAFFAYLEDVDISYRGKIYGYKNYFCADALVYHIGSGTSGGSKHNQFKVRMSARNNIYLIYKNMTNIQLIINSVFLLIGFIIKYIYFIRKGYGRTYLEGVLEGIKKLRTIKRTHVNRSNVFNYIKIQLEITKNVLYFCKNKFFTW